MCLVVSHDGFELHFSNINNTEHLFMRSFAFCILSLVKYPFQSFAHFLNMVCLLPVEFCEFFLLCFLHVNPSLDTCFVTTFPQPLACLFIFLIAFLEENFFFNFGEVIRTSLYILWIVIDMRYLRNLCLTQDYKGFSFFLCFLLEVL